MPWSVEFHSACGEWAGGLEQGDAESLLAAVPILSDAEPALGRPLVDTVAASRHPSTKELRPGSTWRADIRVLFAFDKTRRAILLVGGDQSHDWRGWYRRNIPVRTTGSRNIRRHWVISEWPSEARRKARSDE
jgi:hypothetical protein